MTDGTLYVVPSDRHVERLSRDGLAAETLRVFEERLLLALLPTHRFAEPAEVRLVLAIALGDPSFKAAGQLALFDAAPVAPGGGGLLEAVRARGGASWSRLVTAVDDAISRVRSGGATADHLRRVVGGDVTVARAQMLAEAMDALDRRLTVAGTVDRRVAPRLLEEAIRGATAERMAEIVGSERVRARWVLAWDAAVLGWWKALDEKLVRRGGFARIALPAFDKPLQGRRELDPLDEIAEEVAAVLDDAPETETIAAPLGHLSAASANPRTERVGVLRTADATNQAREAVRIVEAALKGGAAIDRVAVALPILDAHSLAPLRRAFELAEIPIFEQGTESHSSAPVVATAMLALEAAETLDRVAVARLLRSGYLDATRFVADASPSVARRTVARAAQRLEARATAAAADPVERLVLTVAADAPVEGAAVRGIAAALSKARAARTRRERLTAAWTLWSDLGISQQAGRGGLESFGRDTRPDGVSRAERAAVARDARAWEALSNVVELAEAVTARSSGDDLEIDAEAFRVELTTTLDTQTRRPAAGGAAAVRIGRLESFVGEQLESLTILDCVDGRIPANDSADRLVTTAFAAALTKSARGAFRAPREGLARARSLAALASATAESDAIQLVYPTEDATGAPLEPSAIVELLVRGGVPVTAEVADVTTAGPSAAARATRERAREAFFLDPSRPRSDIVGDLAGSTTASAIHDLLSHETGGGPTPMAVTSLERFARCAFRGMAEVVLGARDPERRQELPDAREEGTVVHEVLAAAFTAVADDWKARPRDVDVIVEKANAAVEAVLDAWQGHAPLRAIVRLRVREGVRAVLLAAIADEEWDFANAEQPFGAGGHRGKEVTPWPMPEIRRGEEALRLRGTIDRVDVAHDNAAVRVIDYKRSASTVKESMRSLGETALQIPLYAGIATRVTRKPADGLYMATQARDFATTEAAASKKNRDRLAELLQRDSTDDLSVAEIAALELVKTVRHGHLVPIPASEGECRTCAMSGGCRKPRFAMVAADESEESG